MTDSPPFGTKLDDLTPGIGKEGKKREKSKFRSRSPSIQSQAAMRLHLDMRVKRLLE